VTRCAEVSEAAGEPLSATATTAVDWLLVEVRGSWPRDVAEGGLDAGSRATVSAWLDALPSSRLMFIRRPGRGSGPRLAFVVRAAETGTEVRQLEFAETDGLTGLDLASAGVIVDRQLVLVCGHGTRDACCALRGSAVLGALTSHVAPQDLWLSSHQGGHRFAANVLVLPAALQFGRVDAANVERIVGAALAGEIALEHYRGRTAYTAREQAAERVVREARSLLRVSELELLWDDGDGGAVRGRGWDRASSGGNGALRPCGARELRRRRRAAAARHGQARLTRPTS
jgi:hypothetical protein